MTLQGKQLNYPVSIDEFINLLDTFTQEFKEYVAWQIEETGQINFLHNFYYHSPLVALFGRNSRPPMIDNDITEIIRATGNGPGCNRELRNKILNACGITETTLGL